MPDLPLGTRQPRVDRVGERGADPAMRGYLLGVVCGDPVANRHLPINGTSCPDARRDDTRPSGRGCDFATSIAAAFDRRTSDARTPREEERGQIRRAEGAVVIEIRGACG